MPTTTRPDDAVVLAHRRCWRCLETFTVDAPAAVRADFWLCDPCDAILLPSKRRSS